MVRSVKRPTPGFDSGHDPTVHGTELPGALCADSMEPAWDFSVPFSLCPPRLARSLSLNKYINKHKKKKLPTEKQGTGGSITSAA